MGLDGCDTARLCQQRDELLPLCREVVFASPLEGELCFASRTLWRLRPDDEPLRPHRALTAVRIVNRASSALSIERLKLPAPHLALYQAADGTLWTQDVRYVRSEGDDFAALRLRDRAPAGAEGAVRLAEPRERREEHGVVRAFQSLFD